MSMRLLSCCFVLLGLSCLVGCPENTPPTTNGGTGAPKPGTIADTGEINIDGSSSTGPVTEVAVEAYAKAGSGTIPSVKKSGTGAGFKKFATGGIDICDASRPITAD